MRTFRRSVSRVVVFFVSSAASLCAQLDIRDGLVFQYALDETEGTIANDATGSYPLRYWGGTPQWQQPGVFFHAANQHFFKFSDGVPSLRETFTMSAWVRSDNTIGWRGVLDMYSVAMLVIDGKLVLENRGDPFFNEAGSTGFGNTDSTGTLEWGTWHHVAISNNGSRTRFFIDGEMDREVVHQVIPNQTVDIQVGRRDAGAIDYFHGAIRDVRVYNRELTPSEVGILHEPPNPDETMAGLWVGEMELNEVKNVTTGEWGEAGSPFYSKAIVYSDAVENMLLLQEATLMRTRGGDPQEAVITQANLVANYDGIVPRGDKLVGMRISSATFPLPFDQVAFAGTGSGDEIAVSVTLPAAHPKNPFRHKYHPDLGIGREITRTLTIDWEDEDLPTDGQRRAVVSERITGLHKDTLEVRGTAVFARVSTSQLLNP